jgi:hypothetical protein
MPRVDSADGKREIYLALQTLDTLVETQARGLPNAVEQIFRNLVPLRPAVWWEESYLIQLRQLSFALYLASFYQRKEADYAHKGDLAEARKFNELAKSNMSIVKSLQVTLQLTPSMLKGQARVHEPSMEIDAEMRSLEDDPQDSKVNLYAN